jgi:hypothetical protein
MAPAQPFMDIDLDVKPPIIAKMALDKEKRGLRCMSNCRSTNIETHSMLDDQTKALKCSEDLEVDIIGCTVKSEIRSIKNADPDATEYSSSFADTTSNTENCSGLSEGEVESQLFGDDSLASAFDVFSTSLQMRFVLILYFDSFNCFCPLAFLAKDGVTSNPQVSHPQRVEPYTPP